MLKSNNNNWQLFILLLYTKFYHRFYISSIINAEWACSGNNDIVRRCWLLANSPSRIEKCTAVAVEFSTRFPFIFSLLRSFVFSVRHINISFRDVIENEQEQESKRERESSHVFRCISLRLCVRCACSMLKSHVFWALVHVCLYFHIHYYYIYQYHMLII